jgi:hypothetical protein
VQIPTTEINFHLSKKRAMVQLPKLAAHKKAAQHETQ